MIKEKKTSEMKTHIYLKASLTLGNFFRTTDCVSKPNMRCFIAIKIWPTGQDIARVASKPNGGLGTRIIYVGHGVAIGHRRGYSTTH